MKWEKMTSVLVGICTIFFFTSCGSTTWWATPSYGTDGYIDYGYPGPYYGTTKPSAPKPAPSVSNKPGNNKPTPPPPGNNTKPGNSVNVNKPTPPGGNGNQPAPPQGNGNNNAPKPPSGNGSQPTPPQGNGGNQGNVNPPAPGNSGGVGNNNQSGKRPQATGTQRNRRTGAQSTH